MGRVIHVNFKEKHKVESYTVTPWVCIVCVNEYSLDSRFKHKSTRILVRDATPLKDAEYICKSCCIQLSEIAKEQGWKNDAD